MDKTKEVRLQKGLTLGWLGCLASIPFTGPLGLIGAGAIFTGQVLRLTTKEGSWDAYAGRVLSSGENSDYKKDNENEVPSTFYSSPPAIDSNFSKNLAKFMKRENERRGYESSLENGRIMVEEYFSNLPRKEYSHISRIEILEKDKTFLGFPTGNKSLEVKVE